MSPELWVLSCTFSTTGLNAAAESSTMNVLNLEAPCNGHDLRLFCWVCSVMKTCIQPVAPCESGRLSDLKPMISKPKVPSALPCCPVLPGELLNRPSRNQPKLSS